VKQLYRRQFRIKVIVQVFALVATCVLFAWTNWRAALPASSIVLAIVIALQVYGLLRTVAAHVDALEEFFAAINYEDFTRHFVQGDIDAELRDAFNRIIDRFRAARAERDLQASYLETVVRHLPVAFIAERADGTLRLVNHPARRLTGLSDLGHLDQLGVLDDTLPARLRALQPGTRQMLQTQLHNIPAELRVSVAEIRFEGQLERLYSLENLSGELTAREASAWRNLIRVLTHEIMNTLTPVTSLAQSCASMVDDPLARDDLRDAVATIARRSDGLTEFVSSYRELLKVPDPQPEVLPVLPVLQGVVRLLSNELENVTVHVNVRPESLTVTADPRLLDQVLLNLLSNALDALQDTSLPEIRLDAALDAGRVVIRVADNGQGIPENVRDQVFVPFFTTRREGSGIGLSLCRQIMSAHGGEIALGKADKGTVAMLRF
jgi:nitrogen fixation/metabolism regulation signal transduction histidine kinase